MDFRDLLCDACLSKIEGSGEPPATLVCGRCRGKVEAYFKELTDRLTAEFDEMLERMQAPGAREAMDRAFHATPEELGKAAVAAARKRKDAEKK